MKIAVATLEKDEKSEVSPVAGRAPFYLIFEGKKLIKALKNPFRFGGGGAGFGVAKMLANEGVNLVVCGKAGPNMQMALDQNGIKAKFVTGKTAKQVVEKVAE